MSAAMELDGIYKTYGSGATISVEHLELVSGKVTCIVGPSGAGKSTLMRIAGLLEPPDSGKVAIAGKGVSPKSLDARRRVASVMQRPFLFAKTVREQVAYGLHARSTPAKAADNKVMKALRDFGVHELADRNPKTLSGGEARRVAIAAALVLEPEVLILDEPMSNVDEPLRDSLCHQLCEATHSSAMATAWVTHDRTEALLVADRLAVMIDGSVAQAGTPREVFIQPASTEVADFLGSRNLMEGRVTSNTEGLANVGVSGHSFEVMSDASEGTPVWVLVRPEDLSVWTKPPAQTSPRNKVSGTVIKVQDRGPLVSIQIGSDLPLEAFVTRATRDELGLQPGIPVWFGFKSAAATTITRLG